MGPDGPSGPRYRQRGPGGRAVAGSEDPATAVDVITGGTRDDVSCQAVYDVELPSLDVAMQKPEGSAFGPVVAKVSKGLYWA